VAPRNVPARVRQLDALDRQLGAARRQLLAAIRGGVANRDPKVARALASSLVFAERARKLLLGPGGAL
jgi:hypothetical protein